MDHRFQIGQQVAAHNDAGEVWIVRVAEVGQGVVGVTTESEWLAAERERRPAEAYICYPKQDLEILPY